MTYSRFNDIHASENRAFFFYFKECFVIDIFCKEKIYIISKILYNKVISQTCNDALISIGIFIRNLVIINKLVNTVFGCCIGIQLYYFLHFVSVFIAVGKKSVRSIEAYGKSISIFIPSFFQYFVYFKQYSVSRLVILREECFFEDNIVACCIVDYRITVEVNDFASCGCDNF